MYLIEYEGLIGHEGYVAVYSKDSITGHFCGKVINCVSDEISFSSEKAEDMPRLLAEGVANLQQFCVDKNLPAPRPSSFLCN